MIGLQGVQMVVCCQGTKSVQWEEMRLCSAIQHSVAGVVGIGMTAIRDRAQLSQMQQGYYARSPSLCQRPRPPLSGSWWVDLIRAWLVKLCEWARCSGDGKSQKVKSSVSGLG